MRDNALPSYIQEYYGDSVAGAKSEEDSCPAFTFLRGLDARALAVEFRWLSGNSVWFSYSHLVSWHYNRSVGLLLKFTSDVTSLLLIHGSNLDVPMGDAQVNLTDRGLQRHRIILIREMSDTDLKKARKGEPTIDRIELGEFESVEEQRKWLKERAPAFVGEPR